MLEVLSVEALSWLRDGDCLSVPAEWVPGASNAELASLGALGALCRSVINGSDPVPHGLDEWLIVETVPEWLQEEFLTGIRAGGDRFLSEVYANLVSPGSRRRLGTFFTPSEEVEAVLDLWAGTQPTPDEVLDLGAGVGAFTFAAAFRWPLSRVVAIDVNPITLGLLFTQYVAGYDHENRSKMAEIEFVLGDFASWIKDNPSDPSGTRLVTGNPPYTRAQLLPVEERRRMYSLAGGLCGSRANLATLMTAISVLELGTLDGVCLVLPSSWLEADYARGLRDHLCSLLNRRVEIQVVESSMFADARVDAVVLLVGASDQHPDFIAGAWKGVQSIVARESMARSAWRLTGNGVVVEVPLSSTDRVTVRQKVGAASKLNLSDYATISRGVATGANFFFVLPSEVVDELPFAYRRSVVTRIRNLPSGLEDVSGVRWLLACGEDDVPKSLELRRYLKLGISEGLPNRKLCSARRVWFDLRREISVPDIIVGSMSRGAFQIASNVQGSAITNNLYGLKWRENVSVQTRNLLTAWLRSSSGQYSLQSAARRRGDGLLKLEISGLRNVSVGDF